MTQTLHVTSYTNHPDGDNGTASRHTQSLEEPGFGTGFRMAQVFLGRRVLKLGSHITPGCPEVEEVLLQLPLRFPLLPQRLET